MAPSWKQLKCPSAGEWINYDASIQWNTTHNTQCNKLPILTTLQMNLKCILFSERSHLNSYTLYDSMYATFWKS